MPGIRLHPNYHNYALDDPSFDRLLDRSAERGIVVQLVSWLEDERHHNPLMIVPEVDLRPLLGHVERRPGLRVVVLNGFRSVGGPGLLALLESGLVWVDFAKLDILDGLARLLDRASIASSSAPSRRCSTSSHPC